MEKKSIGLISVIVRAHNPAKNWLLFKAIDSLAKQSYQNIEIVLILQNYTQQDILDLESSLGKILKPRNIHLQIENIENPSGKDLRSRALNRGLAMSRGQRIAFLDYDDVLYPSALERLSRIMDSSQAGCVVGACDLTYVEYENSSEEIRFIKKERFYRDRPSLERLKHHGFFTIHSLLIDKQKLGDLKFPEDMFLFEDYAFFLELSMRTSFDFSLFYEEALCEYRVRNVKGDTLKTIMDSRPDLHKEQLRKIWGLRRRLGFLNLFYYFRHPFYYPIKTKFFRFFK